MFWILRQAKKNNKDDRINIIIEPDVIGTDEAYIYEAICDYPPEHKGKWYLGSHLENGKIYWHSGESKELGELWVDRNCRFTYRVLQSGTYKKMKTRESYILKKRNAIKDKMSWNQNHGSSDKDSKANDTDIDKIKDILKDIKKVKKEFEDSGYTKYGSYMDGKYSIKHYNKRQIEAVEFVQVRESKLIKDNVTNMNYTMESDGTKGFFCVVLDRYTPDNKDHGIGGNHTKESFTSGKHSKKGTIDIISISESIWKGLNDIEVQKLGKALNSRPDNEMGEPTIPEDVYLDYVEQYENDEKSWDSVIKIELEEIYSFKLTHLRKTKKLIKNVVENNKAQRDRNETFEKVEKDSPKYKKLLKLRKKYKNKKKGIGCKIISPESVNFERESNHCKDNNLKELVIIVCPNTPLSDKKWTKRKKEFWKCHDTHSKNIGRKPVFKFEFVYINNWIPNIVK